MNEKMQFYECVSLEVKGHAAIIAADNPPVNALSHLVRKGLIEAIDAAEENDNILSLIFICVGKTFFAGADIKEFGKPPQAPSLRDLIARIEKSSKTTIAALHGSALGGGLELALGANYRLAALDAQCGLPEVNIGIIPGAGGTQRLPRIVGCENALDIITSGRRVSAREAMEIGLFDRLAGGKDLLSAALQFAEDSAAGRTPPPIDTSTSLAADAAAAETIIKSFGDRNESKFRGVLAPHAAIKAVKSAYFMSFEEGLKAERELFDELTASDQPAAMRHVFFSEREAAKLDASLAGIEPRSIAKVGVMGAGTMGGGIAMNFLNIGMPVIIIDRTQEALDRGTRTIRKNYEISAKRGKLSVDDIEARMARLSPTTDIKALAECDLIIEAVFEQIDVKREAFKKLDSIAKPGAILATNTSYLDIDEIASATTRPESVIGLHFFSPANVMRLLEVVRASKTAVDVIVTCMKLGKEIGKVAVLVGNGWGFVGNRILQARQKEAEQLILEGAAPWEVDRIIVDFGFAMGPFQMRDLVGLDVGWDPNDTASRTVREILNEMGRHGQKSGAGFYEYKDGRTATPSDVTLKVIEDFANQKQIKRRRVEEGEIHDRLLYAMVNEGARILEDGIAAKSSDIDVIWITGYGWPKYKGGPMYWADHVGLDRICRRLIELQKAHGEHFAPAPLLQNLARSGRKFTLP